MKNPAEFFKMLDDYYWFKDPKNGFALMTKEEYDLYCQRLDYEDQHEAEQYAESAWLRHAEQASYDDMAFERYERERGCY